MNVCVNGQRVPFKIVNETTITRYVRRWKWLPFFRRPIQVTVSCVPYVQLEKPVPRELQILVMYETETNL